MFSNTFSYDEKRNKLIRIKDNSNIDVEIFYQQNPYFVIPYYPPRYKVRPDDDIGILIFKNLLYQCTIPQFDDDESRFYIMNNTNYFLVEFSTMPGWCAFQIYNIEDSKLVATGNSTGANFTKDLTRYYFFKHSRDEQYDGEIEKTKYKILVDHKLLGIESILQDELDTLKKHARFYIMEISEFDFINGVNIDHGRGLVPEYYK